MTEMELAQRERQARRYAGTIILASLLSVAIVGAMIVPAWQFFTRWEERLDRRETRLDERESAVQVRESAGRDEAIENEKLRLSLLRDQEAVQARRDELAQSAMRMTTQAQELEARQKKVGIDALEFDLRQEAKRLIAEYTAIMSKPENVSTSCARQYAHKAAAPLLARIRSIGKQLRQGIDLIEFADSQSVGMWSSQCDELSAG